MIKIITIVMSVISVLMLGSTLLCGFWIRSHTPAGSAADPGSLVFHMQIAVASVVVVLITLGLVSFK